MVDGENGTGLAVATGSGLGLEGVAESAQRRLAASKSENTRRAYRADASAFAAWCRAHGFSPMPATPETVLLYANALADAGKKPATIRRAITSVSVAHKAANVESPCVHPLVRDGLRGIRRELGTAQRQAPPVSPDALRAMVRTLGSDARSLRDRALLVLGFAGAFRRGELASLRVADLAFDAAGLTVTVRRSKTDQEGTGERVGVPYGSDPRTCPVRTVRAWLDAAGIVEGFAFRSITNAGRVTAEAVTGHTVNRAIQRAAKAAGLSGFSAHSLRAGLATTAAKAGKSDRAIMKQGRWKSRTMVDRYVRDASLFTDNAAQGIGL